MTVDLTPAAAVDIDAAAPPIAAAPVAVAPEMAELPAEVARETPAFIVSVVALLAAVVLSARLCGDRVRGLSVFVLLVSSSSF